MVDHSLSHQYETVFGEHQDCVDCVAWLTIMNPS